MNDTNSLFAIVGYIGRAMDCADVEVVEIDGVACWPGRGQYNLSRVIYWTSREDAQAMADHLAPYAPTGALVRVAEHHADADYVTRHGAPIRTSLGRADSRVASLYVERSMADLTRPTREEYEASKAKPMSVLERMAANDANFSESGARL